MTGVFGELDVETVRTLAANGAWWGGGAQDLAKAEAAHARVRNDAAAGGGSPMIRKGQVGQRQR